MAESLPHHLPAPQSLKKVFFPPHVDEDGEVGLLCCMNDVHRDLVGVHMNAVDLTDDVVLPQSAFECTVVRDQVRDNNTIGAGLDRDAKVIILLFRNDLDELRVGRQPLRPGRDVLLCSGRDRNAARHTTTRGALSLLLEPPSSTVRAAGVTASGKYEVGVVEADGTLVHGGFGLKAHERDFFAFSGVSGLV